MTQRLNIERQQKLEPLRLQKAIEEITKLGFRFDHNDKQIDILYKGEIISFYPYSGWHQGKGIKPGRGLNNLLKQLV